MRHHNHINVGGRQNGLKRVKKISHAVDNRVRNQGRNVLVVECSIKVEKTLHVEVFFSSKEPFTES